MMNKRQLENNRKSGSIKTYQVEHTTQISRFQK